MQQKINSTMSEKNAQIQLSNAYVELKEVNLTDLNIHPFLKRYGLGKITDFELKQISRLNLPPGEIIVSATNLVLSNWEAVEIARKQKLKKVIVVMVKGIDDDEFIQVSSLKNMRRRLSRYMQAELIIELREYLSNNPYGKIWKDEIPGDCIPKKIGTLIGYSYGMINQIERIYKYNAGLLQQIDDGELTISQAIKNLPSMKDAEDMPEGNENNETKSNESDEEEGEGGEPSDEPKPKLPIVKGSGPRSGFAGQKQMVECEPISGIKITYASGKTLDLSIVEGIASGTLAGKEMVDLIYSSPLFHPIDNSEFHVLSDESGKAGLQIAFWNIESLAA